jgi:addiction module HigA family antidote
VTQLSRQFERVVTKDVPQCAASIAYSVAIVTYNQELVFGLMAEPNLMPDADRMRDYPPHPGGVVLRRCIEPLGLSITDAAAALGVTRTTLSELVNGKRGISPEMAVRLEKLFGGSAESWLVQQARYDLAHVRSDRIKLKRLEPA